MYKLLLTTFLFSMSLLLASCATLNAPQNNKYSDAEVVVTTVKPVEKEITTTNAVNYLKVPTNNFNHSDENLSLSRLESYIRNTAFVIEEARTLQDKNARYKFDYSSLERDLSEIASSIKRFIDHDKSSQTPRKFEPLSKRY